MYKVVKELSGEHQDIDHLIEPLFLGWSKFDHKKKVKQYSQYTCHELNFFLHKFDKPFYDEVVGPFIESKMEKTFIDWYLLSKQSN